MARVPFVVLPLAAAFVGCFPELAVDKLKCNTSTQCPVGYACSPEGTCCESRDGTSCDKSANDAASGVSRDGGAIDVSAGHLEAGMGDGPLTLVDGPGNDVGRDSNDAAPDLPLGQDGPPGGAGGAPGTGGATGRGDDAGADAPMTTGGVAGTGGMSAIGGALGTGGKSGTAGAGSGGASPGQGGALAGRVGTGGSGTGGSGTGGSGTGGSGIGGNGTGGSVPPSCVGAAWPTADPTIAGPFAVAADKNVGPLAGYLPDPIYKDKQQRFNLYRPTNLAQSGYCHPVLVWANGHQDNPEPNPPDCVFDSVAEKYCGSYPVLMTQLASHGFVVIASLSSTPSQGDPLPTMVGLDWLLAQAEDPTSPYYHRLDTAHVGALGHSEGGMTTCMTAGDPRITAIATVSGVTALSGLHGPALFICGGHDNVVDCDTVANTYNGVTDQPAMPMNDLSADHSDWLFQDGTKGPDIVGLTAWFRVHLMGDTANRKYFYGASCTLCTDSRVTVARNSLMTQ